MKQILIHNGIILRSTKTRKIKSGDIYMTNSYVVSDANWIASKKKKKLVTILSEEKTKQKAHFRWITLRLKCKSNWRKPILQKSRLKRAAASTPRVQMLHIDTSTFLVTGKSCNKNQNKNLFHRSVIYEITHTCKHTHEHAQAHAHAHAHVRVYAKI